MKIFIDNFLLISFSYFNVYTVRNDYGNAPYQATVEEDDELKMREQADPPLQPFVNPWDLLHILVYRFTKATGKRVREVSCISVIHYFVSSF